jgi:LysM repeat protein
VNIKIISIIVGVCLVGFLMVKGCSKPKNNTEVQYEMTAETPTTKSSQTAQQLYQQASAFRKDRDLAKAKQVLQQILDEHIDYDQMDVVQADLEKINMEIIFSNTPTSNSVNHEVVSGDTLGKLALQYGTTIDLIKISNHLKSDIIRIGQKLRIWNKGFNIHVDKSQNILILKADNEVIKVYRVSTGKNNSTPVGTFKVTTKLTDPVWFNRGVIVPPESPRNVLGSRWLGFDIPGYGIHGTVEPQTIGQQVTAGCVRMRNAEVEELYSIIPMKTEVTVVD